MTSELNPIDFMRLNFKMYPSTQSYEREEKLVKALGNRTSTKPTLLNLKIFSSCDPNWYNTECTANCVPQNSCDTGFYTCDPIDGSKICANGFTGSNCQTALFDQIGCKIDRSLFHIFD